MMKCDQTKVWWYVLPKTSWSHWGQIDDASQGLQIIWVLN